MKSGISARSGFNEKAVAKDVTLFRCRRCPGTTDRLTGVAVYGGLICQACWKRRNAAVPEGPAAKRAAKKSATKKGSR
jgi:hypothetical protein